MSMISYCTELDIETCKRLIYIQITAESYQRGGLRGKVDFDNNKFKLFKSRRDGRYREFHGELIKKDNGTIINGEFRMPASIIIMAALCSTPFILIWLIAFFSIILGTSNRIDNLLAVTFIIIIIAFVAIRRIKFGYIKKEENYILYVMATKLDATFVQNLS